MTLFYYTVFFSKFSEKKKSTRTIHTETRKHNWKIIKNIYIIISERKVENKNKRNSDPRPRRYLDRRVRRIHPHLRTKKPKQIRAFNEIRKKRLKKSEEREREKENVTLRESANDGGSAGGVVLEDLFDGAGSGSHFHERRKRKGN